MSLGRQAARANHGPAGRGARQVTVRGPRRVRPMVAAGPVPFVSAFT
jgi:hypothetical protein